jgi:4-hydroxythreonine-4-phosphate dehydrogenase
LIRNPVVISIGDPSGIGPEVFLKSIINTELRDNLEKITVICDPRVLTNTLSGFDKSLEINIVADHNQNTPDAINIICSEHCPEYQLGLSEPKTSKYTLNNLIYAADYAHKHSFALVTGPINKKTIRSSFENFTGHTEFLKERYKSDEVLMLLANNSLKVGVLTTHIPLSQVSKSINEDLIIRKTKILYSGIKALTGNKSPKIGILGLNPHAGEGGSFGTEEIDTITPAIRSLEQLGMSICGPLSADTAFLRSDVDAYMSMYHDQALPVIKTLDFKTAVNITLGLPFIRTSVDHGTAEDIAKNFEADFGSMYEAIKLAGNANSS